MSVDEAELIDWNVFCRARSELGAGFARILGYFQEDGEKAVTRIEDAMHRRDPAGLVLPAHTMKSEARQFGADPLGELAEEIEFAARRFVEMRTSPEELVPHVARLRPLYLRTIELLEAEANPLCKRTRTAS